jgi:hypothetical protein
MAKARNLAALAGLAGLAYAMNKGKGKSDDAGDQTTSSYTKDTKKVESDGVPLKTPAQSIAAADKSDKSTSISTKGESGTTTPGPDKSTPDLNENRNKPAAPKPVAKPVSKPVAATSDPRNLEAGMSRGTRTPAKPVSTTSSSEEGMKNYKPRRTPAASTSSSSEAGMKNYKPRNTPANPVKDTAVSAVKAAVNTAVQGPASAVKPLVDKAASSSRVPTSEQAAANRQAAYDKVKSVGSSVVDYVKNFETPAERRSREAKESSGMKRGGSVKMASGGMAASRRGDGIAQRGKTRGKLC